MNTTPNDLPGLEKSLNRWMLNFPVAEGWGYIDRDDANSLLADLDNEGLAVVPSTPPDVAEATSKAIAELRHALTDGYKKSFAWESDYDQSLGEIAARCLPVLLPLLPTAP